MALMLSSRQKRDIADRYFDRKENNNDANILLVSVLSREYGVSPSAILRAIDAVGRGDVEPGT